MLKNKTGLSILFQNRLALNKLIDLLKVEYAAAIVEKVSELDKKAFF